MVHSLLHLQRKIMPQFASIKQYKQNITPAVQSGLEGNYRELSNSIIKRVLKLYVEINERSNRTQFFAHYQEKDKEPEVIPFDELDHYVEKAAGELKYYVRHNTHGSAINASALLCASC